MGGIVAHAAKGVRIEDAPAPGLGPQDIRVRVAFGGICGSGLHYYHHGGFGAVRLREPMILGHQVAGVRWAGGVAVERGEPRDSPPRTPAGPWRRIPHRRGWS